MGTTGDVNLLVEMIKSLLPSSDVPPAVLYCDPTMESLVALLSAEWDVGGVDGMAFAAQVTVEQAHRPVLAMPPRGTQEAKGSADRMSLRLALGQVLDYGRYVAGSQLAVLLPEAPDADLVELLESHDVGCIVDKTSGNFVDMTALKRCP